ncbi:hypothetical protein [Streptomyces sp. TRM68367]|uniref:hypothetical protein n=1 Tax=Streptomyces sp. TRM68367 TaxID=2758415 RepID=UPI00165A48BE|nr:hypothetical protein [Streptomyces sp. TRM68367]MBC9730834.1 hypothetical protein [Streptomyces sp. TRM68367]
MIIQTLGGWVVHSGCAGALLVRRTRDARMSLWLRIAPFVTMLAGLTLFFLAVAVRDDWIHLKRQPSHGDTQEWL